MHNYLIKKDDVGIVIDHKDHDQIKMRIEANGYFSEIYLTYKGVEKIRDLLSNILNNKHVIKSKLNEIISYLPKKRKSWWKRFI